MVALILSDSQPVAAQLRNTLLQRGTECPASHVVPLDAAADAFQGLRSEIELILVVLGADLERSEETLRVLRTAPKARIIAIGPHDPNRILGAFHLGATDYLAEGSNLVDQLTASLDRAASLASYKATLGQVVSVVAGSGGCGRTTIAANLAALAAERHGRCALLDLDLWGGNAAAFLNMKPKHTIAELCRNSGKLDRDILEQSLLTHETGIHLLPAPHAPDDVQDVSLEGVTRILRIVRTVFPYVIVDLENCSHPALRHVLRQSESVLLLSRLDFAAVGNAHKTLEALTVAGVERDRIRFVINRFGQPGELPASRVESALGLKHVEYIPDDTKAVNLSVNCGRLCVVDSPRSRFAAALSTLARKIDPSAAESGTAADPAEAPRSHAFSPHRILARLSMVLS